VAKEPGHRGEHGISVKTIAQGMPVDCGVPVVIMLVCFFIRTRGCGRIARPAFPAPSEFQGQDVRIKLARMRGEIAKLWLHPAGCLTGE
jgi:hypothetical protein